jgi:hypothetical protein
VQSGRGNILERAQIYLFKIKFCVAVELYCFHTYLNLDFFFALC